MSKINYGIEKDIQAKHISYLDRDPKIMSWLEDHGFQTVEEVVARQDEIPKDYMTEIISKLIFNI